MAMYNNSGFDMLPKSTFLPNGSLGGEGEYAEPGKGKVIPDLAKVWVKVGGTLEQVFQLFFTFAPPHFTYRIFLFD